MALAEKFLTHAIRYRDSSPSHRIIVTVTSFLVMKWILHVYFV